MFQNLLMVCNLGAIWQLVVKIMSLESRVVEVERDLDTRLDHIESALAGLGRSIEEQHH